MAELINRDFGSFDAFKTQFAASANSQFGSGWAWLVQDPAGKLSIVKTSNADTPITEGLKPLLVQDVWEHAVRVVIGRALKGVCSSILHSKLILSPFPPHSL